MLKKLFLSFFFISNMIQPSAAAGSGASGNAGQTKPSAADSKEFNESTLHGTLKDLNHNIKGLLADLRKEREKEREVDTKKALKIVDGEPDEKMKEAITIDILEAFAKKKNFYKISLSIKKGAEKITKGYSFSCITTEETVEESLEFDLNGRLTQNGDLKGIYRPERVGLMMARYSWAKEHFAHVKFPDNVPYQGRAYFMAD